jgi:hypothetical protein
MAQIPINAPDIIEELRQANGQVGQGPHGTLFRVQPLPQPGQGCRERWVIWHSYATGVPMSKTEVAITLGGQAIVIRPRFRWDDVDDRRKEPMTLRDTLGAIFDEDLR